MSYFRIIGGRDERRRDPLEGFVVAKPSRDDAETAAIKPDRAVREKWSPPEGSRTFSTVGIEGARTACRNRRHVIIREDPMFGRRGYAKEIIPDDTHGFLVLVIAFVVKKDPYLGWKEPFKPRDTERMYWPPTKVEFA